MAQNANGISTLLEAEKEASKIVQKAREYRVARLKDARKEAEKEIAAAKAQKVAEYERFEKEHAGSTDAHVQKVNADIEARLVQTQRDFEQNKNLVLQKLVQAVVNVKPELHRNLQFNPASKA
ncbi:hypothetical protein RI367_007126 [Sorochytrium milnesiophthora]